MRFGNMRLGFPLIRVGVFVGVSVLLAAVVSVACGRRQPTIEASDKAEPPKQAPSPEMVAQLMVDDVSKTRGVSAMQGLDVAAAEPDAVRDWGEALEAAMGERQHVMITLQVMAKTGELYREGSFQAAESHKLADRARGLSTRQELLKDWEDALTRFDPSVDKLNTLWIVIRQSEMFDQATLNQPIADRQLKRLHSLPAEAVASWATALEATKAVDASASKIWAASRLIRVEPLFIDTTFQPALFDRALPHTDALIAADATRKEAAP